MPGYRGIERRAGDIDRTLGEHGAILKVQSDDIAEIKADIKTLLADKHESEGSRKTVYAWAAAVGSIGGMAASFAHKLIP